MMGRSLLEAVPCREAGVSRTPGFPRLRERSLFWFVCPAEAFAEPPDPGRRSSPRRTHTCAGVRPEPEVGQDWSLSSAAAQGREGAHKSSPRLGTPP